MLGKSCSMINCNPNREAVWSEATQFKMTDLGKLLQLIGGIIYGLGMALLEATHVDAETGRIVNANIAEYLVPVNADVPDIQTIVVTNDEIVSNPLGAKGIGELPMVGVAAAVANAVYHATGVRVRTLPIRIEDLIA